MEKSAAKAIPNELFSYEIKHRHWTDRQVAAKILELLDIKDEEVRKKQAQTDEDRVKRWRRGVATPSPYFQGLLEKLFGKKIEQLGWPGKNKIPHWKIDDPQNPLFTGREDILKWLHDGLDFRSTGASLPIQILTGLAGVGKSQSAIEYAHNFMHKYHTIIWLRASNKELLAADFAAIASYIGLNLPEEAKDDQKEQIEAVKAWLYHEEISRWLLVFDSADDPAIINEIVHRYVPERYETEPRKGHVIITTRSSATGEIEQQKEVDPLSIEDSIHFLFRRAKISASETNNTLAKSLAEKLGGLPLALEQAGAYIEETGCGLAGYVNLYQTTAERKGLLASKGAFTNYSHDPIAITLSLTFEQIQQASILAYDLLSLFAFYAPDHIPEELVRKGASILSLNIQAIAEHPKLFDDAMGELMKYSLIRRYSETATCSIHPLVQTCLKDRLDEETQQLWAERAVDVVNLAFPNGSPETLVECERYLPHALVCETLVEHWKIVSKEAARLLNEVGAYLAERGKYKEAESHLTNALTIRQQIFNPQHPVVLESRNNIAALYNYIGLYEQAEAMLIETLTLIEQAPRLDENQLAVTFSTLAFLYLSQGNYIKAKSYYHLALDLWIKLLGFEHPDVATIFNNLAVAYRSLEAYEQATQYQEKALSIYKGIYSSEHPEVARCLNNMAAQYRDMGEYEQAEPLYIQALHMREKTLGSEHPDVANSLHGLGELYRRKGKYQEAEQFLSDALSMREKLLGTDHIDTAFTLYSLAQTYDTVDKSNLAESYYKRALTIREQIMGGEHPQTIIVMESYATFLRKRDREPEARELEKRFQLVKEKTE